MMLGKRARARHPMQRTTSMTEFSFDDLSVLHPTPPPPSSDQTVAPPASDDRGNQMLAGLVSPRLLLHRRNSADFAATATHSSSSFLRTCGLCRRRLAPGRDIFMYRGDTAFCSSECRQQQMAQDEWREKCGIVSTTTKEPSSTTTSTSGSIVSSAKGETVAAV